LRTRLCARQLPNRLGREMRQEERFAGTMIEAIPGK
jgi:hypothetical protein